MKIRLIPLLAAVGLGPLEKELPQRELPPQTPYWRDFYMAKAAAKRARKNAKRRRDYVRSVSKNPCSGAVQ